MDISSSEYGDNEDKNNNKFQLHYARPYTIT